MSDRGAFGLEPDQWEKRYLDDDLPWDSGVRDAHLGRVLDEFELTSGRVLEIGCGTGTNAIWLDSLGFDVVGLDLSATAIERARLKATNAAAKCKFLKTNFLEEVVPGGPFDMAYDRGCLHTFDKVDERLEFSERVASLLNPEGIWHSLIGSTDGPPRDGGPPRRSAAEIIAAVESSFEILQLQSTFFDSGLHAEARAWVLVARRR